MSSTTVFRMLLCGECYEKPSTVQHLEQWIICTHLSVSVFVTPHSNIWNTIAKLFWKHPVLPVEVTLNRKYPM
jgi:hypothetical protein